MIREEKTVTAKDEVVVVVSEEAKEESSVLGAVPAPSTLDIQLLLNMISQQQTEISALRYVWYHA